MSVVVHDADIERWEQAARRTAEHSTSFSNEQMMAQAILTLADRVKLLRRVLYEHHATKYTRLPAGVSCPICEQWQPREERELPWP